MTLRTPRERAFQTILFELGGLIIVTPAYMLLFGHGLEESLTLVIALSVAVMMWSALFNTGFDWSEHRLTGRVASDRPHRWRLVHAALHEVTALVVTLPLIMWITGLPPLQALALEVGLTLFYVSYAYVFHMIFDRLFPVRVATDLQGQPIAD